MNKNLRQRIYNNLVIKNDEDLIAIWKKNDRAEWTNTTFDLIEEILLDRLGKLPAQDPPFTAYSKESSCQKYPIGEEPVLYSPRKVYRFQKWLDQAAIVIIILSIIFNFTDFYRENIQIRAHYYNDDIWKITAGIITFFFTSCKNGIVCILYFFAFKGLSVLLGILMEMEFASRNSIQPQNKKFSD
jgi:hypothetical protein